MPPSPVSLDVVLENARLKYPQYKNIPDAQLTKALVTKYPQYRNVLDGHSKAVADVMSGKHDPLGILDPQTSVKALRAKYPTIKGTDKDLEQLVSGNYGVRQRLIEDPTSTFTTSPRPFTKAEISDMPLFLQKSALQANMAIANDRELMPQDIAHEYAGGEIRVDTPSMFDRPVMAHELTHVYQDARTREFTFPPDQKTDKYNYGGMNGLKKAIQDRKTIANFSVEQQASIVEDYYRAHRDMLAQGKLNPRTASDFEEMKKTYGPFIRQLAGVPTDEDLYKPIGTPPPPGVPGYEATGYVSGDKNIMDFMIPVKKDNISSQFKDVNLTPLL
jgi:hypothetical protein